jgi:hypothetical protein
MHEDKAGVIGIRSRIDIDFRTIAIAIGKIEIRSATRP